MNCRFISERRGKRGITHRARASKKEKVRERVKANQQINHSRRSEAEGNVQGAVQKKNKWKSSILTTYFLQILKGLVLVIVVHFTLSEHSNSQYPLLDQIDAVIIDAQIDLISVRGYIIFSKIHCSNLFYIYLL